MSEASDVQITETAEAEFLGLPDDVRKRFAEAIELIARTVTPTESGVGWQVQELRQRRRVFPGGLFSLHVEPVYRALFLRRGKVLKLFAFGAHVPDDDVYEKLERLRNELKEDPTR